MNIDVPIEEEVNEDPVTHLEFVPVVTPGGIIHERIEGNEIQIKITKEWENVPNEASPEATLELYDTSTGIVIETITLTKENTETTVTVPQRSDGTLTLVPEYPEDTQFNNVYRVKDEVVLTAVKELKGRDLEKDEFSFVLKDQDKKVIETVKNNEDGKVIFSALEYTQEDIGKEFRYFISEVAEDLDHVVYDKTEHEIIVRVIGSQNGELEIQMSHETLLKFINVYEEPVEDPKLPETGTLQSYYQLLGLAVVAGGVFVLEKRRRDL